MWNLGYYYIGVVRMLLQGGNINPEIKIKEIWKSRLPGKYTKYRFFIELIVCEELFCQLTIQYIKFRATGWKNMANNFKLPK